MIVNITLKSVFLLLILFLHLQQILLRTLKFLKNIIACDYIVQL